MTALSSLEYPHWLMIVGALLLALGLVGLALRQRSVDVEPHETASDQELFEPEITPFDVQNTDYVDQERNSDRSDDQEREGDPSSTDRRKIYDPASR